MTTNAPGRARAGAPARLDELLGAVDAARRRAADEVLQENIGNAILQPAELTLVRETLCQMKTCRS
jgi:hypothetical protein